MLSSWCESPFGYSRRPTREVRIGDVAVGAHNPIRVQSMTTPATSDVEGTVAQIVRLVEAGCEIVRVTVPTTSDARALPEIRKKLAELRIKVPLVADIHFSPGAALKAVEHVEKIRVNPGNYADRKQFSVREYSDAEYDAELQRLAETFRPLVRRARDLGVAMRIGTNHGSLSDRILNRYGDSPLGMVESALEFVRICENEGYRELVISMKASNPVVTIEAYRLLAARMTEERMDYPFHLGVTEAGDGVDGRIKSAIGIGSLLDDGIGDTVRVSLTEDPVLEVPVAQRLVAPYNRTIAAGRDRESRAPALSMAGEAPFDPFSYRRRSSRRLSFGPYALGGEEVVRVEVPLRSALSQSQAIREEIDAQAGPRVPSETRADLVEAEIGSPEDLPRIAALHDTLELLAPALALSARFSASEARRFLSSLPAPATSRRPDDGGPTPSLRIDRIVLPAEPVRAWIAETGLAAEDLPVHAGSPILLEGSSEALLEVLTGGRPSSGPWSPLRGALAVTLAGGQESAHDNRAHQVPNLTRVDTSNNEIGFSPGPSLVHDYRRLAAGLKALALDLPIVLSHDGETPGQDPLLHPSLVLGSLLCDGIGDAVRVGASDATASRALAFNILQGARIRMSRTEFISCPSCGRTLFDLEETTRRIKDRTAHLKGLKIAIMGCVVNGPGEMADADFGYVGWGTGKIALFVGKDLVARDIPTAEADERLVALIKEHGKWQDPVLSPDPVS